MNKDTVIQVILRLRDELGGQAKKTLGALTQATKGVTQGFETAGKAARTLGATRDALGRLTGAVRETSGQLQGAGRAASGLAREVGQAARAEGSLGREARTAKREIDETAKAGGRLANALTRAGTAGKTAWGAIRGVGQAVPVWRPGPPPARPWPARRSSARSTSKSA